MTHQDEHGLFPLIREPASRWEKAGLNARQEHRFTRLSGALVGVFVAGWVWSIGFSDRGLLHAGSPVAQFSARVTGSPFAKDAAPEAAFLIDEFVGSLATDLEDAVGGESGAIRVVIAEPGEAPVLGTDSLPEGAQVVLQPSDSSSLDRERPANAAPGKAGIWNVMLRMRDAIRPAGDVRVISLVPLSEKREGRIGQFMIGDWPYEKGGAPKDIYQPPTGFIEVTRENQDLWLSDHVQLRDFITKGQDNVWPKYVVVNPRVLDKIELVVQELERTGHPVENLFAVSGFRTPWYNANGGTTAGRGALSRHMYGDAMDIAVDNDRNSLMDDLNGDGTIDLKDAKVIGQAVDRVEARYPALVGGMHYYPPTGGHRGMVHIDTRGYRARW